MQRGVKSQSQDSLELPKTIVGCEVDWVEECFGLSETEDFLDDVNVTILSCKWQEFQAERT